MEMTGLSIPSRHKKEVVIRGGKAGFHYGNKLNFLYTAGSVLKSRCLSRNKHKKGDIFEKADVFLFIPCFQHK